MLRRINLGVSRTDLLLFVLAIVAALVLTVLWHLFLIDLIGSVMPGNEQLANKYFLTFILLGLSALVTLVSLFVARREGGVRTRHDLIAGVMIRFGLALQIIGIIITPIGLVFATDPERSVPVGFAAFTMVFLGLFISGFGGNMVAPRRA